MDRKQAIAAGGLGLIGFGLLLWLEQSTKATATTKPPPAPGSGLTACNRAGSGSILRSTQFYNWEDLRPLPLNPSDPHDWNHGGGTTELGWIPGTTVYWSEAKYAVAGDGIVGWYVRVSDRPGDTGGAWALPAVDVTTRPVCP